MSLTQKHKQEKDFAYTKWNTTTAICYHNNLCCANCSNRQVCDNYSFSKNEYGIKPVKYATIKTYQNIGKANYRQYL
jgi:hypothetical protein